MSYDLRKLFSQEIDVEEDEKEFTEPQQTSRFPTRTLVILFILGWMVYLWATDKPFNSNTSPPAASAHSSAAP